MVDEQLPIDGVGHQRSSRRVERRQAQGLPAPTDPLSADLARSLITSTSVVRDPLHHDIRVTDFERALIDTRAFQRLRLINQLAMVDSVYPGATHTRFLHSLGTLHVCSELILACNNTVKMLRPLAPAGDPVPVKIGPYAELLARLVALLHDLAHVPFGHVFEREAQVFSKDEWEDPWRVSQTFAPGSDFNLAFRDAFVRHFEEGAAHGALGREEAETAADGLLADVKAVLVAKGPAILSLRYPFVYDLVSNTICADLLDYVQRDMYFAGLTEGLATRFLNSLGVVPVELVPGQANGHSVLLRPVRGEFADEYAPPRSEQGGSAIVCRVVLLQYRYNKRGAPTTKENILPEAIDLVRRRKLVAEKLYFHKTKLTATSMLAAAAHASGINSAEQVWNKTDHEVLTMMLREGQESPRDDEGTRRRWLRARRLAQALLDRRFLKPIYRVSYHPNIDDQPGRMLWHDETGVYSRFKKPTTRDDLIERIELAIEANCDLQAFDGAGTVSVSCPNKDMQLKGFEMLVLPYPAAAEVRPLEQTVRPTVKEEIEVIKKQHMELWRLEVFVDPKIVAFGSPFAQRLAGAIQHEIGPDNEITEFARATSHPLDQLIREGIVDRELRKHALHDKITHVHRTALLEGVPARGPVDLRAQLKEWNYIA